MQFIMMLLVAVGVLTVLTGISVFAGIQRENRGQGMWFFVLTLGTTIWEMAIGIFLNLHPDAVSAAPVALSALYIGAPIMLVGFVGYTGWRYKLGKVATIIYAIMATWLAVSLLNNPSLLYSDIILSNNGNSIAIVSNGWYYMAYMAFCVITGLSMLGFTLYSLAKARNHNEKRGLTVLMVGTSIAAVTISLFDLFLPLIRYDLIWVGPLATSANILCFYYAILRYRLMPVNASSLKVLSYIVIIASAAILYMCIFFVVFAAIFRGATPSAPILILNFLMILIIMLMMPAFNELTASIRSLISVRQIDITYVVKHLNRLAGANIRYNELATFLADHLHFQYVGIVVNGHIYSSRTMPISSDQLSDIMSLKAPDYGVWQKIPRGAQRTFEELGLVAAAQLRDEKGKPYGQVVLGRPQGGVSFEHRDLLQIEVVLNIVGNVAEGKKR